MPIPSSSLSIICDHVRDFVSSGIGAPANGIDVTIGAPAGLQLGTDHVLNLFFYRFEPSGFEAGAQPDLPWRIRMFCMATPFGIDEADGGTTVQAGENDMRMLGDVMRVFHENPVLPPIDAGGIAVRTRIVFMSTTDEQINQIWSTQGDTHYRPSAVYEMSLTPIVPRDLAPEPAIVGAIGAEVRADGDRHAGFTGAVSGPPVEAVSIDTGDPGWEPALAFVYASALHRTLAFDVASAEFAAFTPQLWLAGDPGTPVDLVWEAWRTTGWEASGPPQAATPFGPVLDPHNIPFGAPGFPLATALPEALAGTETSLQLLLHARRSFTRYPGGPTETVRSAPLLVTLYRSSS